MSSLTQSGTSRFSVNRRSTRNSNSHHRSSGVENSANHESIVTRAAPEALALTVEREIIPRLVVAHRPLHAISALRSLPAIAEADIIEFAGLLAHRDLPEALSQVEMRRDRGASLETLYLQLLIPAARRLSHLWDADLCHYDEIAVGMVHLRQVLNELSAAFSLECERRPCGKAALLLSAPGEQSMLGVFMVTEFYRCLASEFFHRAGWDVWRGPPTSRTQLRTVVSTHWFDVIELSASCEARLPALMSDVVEIRKASRNSNVTVVVGGPVFTDHPEFVSQVGADAGSSDPQDTLEKAEKLVGMRDG